TGWIDETILAFTTLPSALTSTSRSPSFRAMKPELALREKGGKSCRIGTGGTNAGSDDAAGVGPGPLIGAVGLAGGAAFARRRNPSASRRTSANDGSFVNDSVRSSRSAMTRSNSAAAAACSRSEEHTSELQSLRHLVCRLLL